MLYVDAELCILLVSKTFSEVNLGFVVLAAQLRLSAEVRGWRHLMRRWWKLGRAPSSAEFKIEIIGIR